MNRINDELDNKEEEIKIYLKKIDNQNEQLDYWK